MTSTKLFTQAQKFLPSRTHWRMFKRQDHLKILEGRLLSLSNPTRSQRAQENYRVCQPRKNFTGREETNSRNNRILTHLISKYSLKASENHPWDLPEAPRNLQNLRLTAPKDLRQDQDLKAEAVPRKRGLQSLLTGKISLPTKLQVQSMKQS